MSFAGKVALFAIAALVVSQGAFAATGFSVQSNGNGHLYKFDFSTGAATDMGQIAFGDAEGLAFAGDQLYAVGGTVEEFWNITTPPGFRVGYTGDRNGLDAGMDFNVTNNTMYNIQGDWYGSTLYRIDIATGAATYIGGSSIFADGLAISSSGVAYCADVLDTDRLYTVDLTTGALTPVGSLGFNPYNQSGMTFDENGNLWMLLDSGSIYSINPATGLATLVSQVNIGGTALSGFEGLASPRQGEQVIPELPAPMLASLAGLVGLAWKRRR